jgi:hypothetical protein
LSAGNATQWPWFTTFRADLDQLFLQARQRPVIDRFWRRQLPQEIAEIV